MFQLVVEAALESLENTQVQTTKVFQDCLEQLEVVKMENETAAPILSFML